MKYKVGDKVRVHTKEWFETNCSRGYMGSFEHERGENTFVIDMIDFCGREVTIDHIDTDNYIISEDDGLWSWEDWMFEEKENIIDWCELLNVEENKEFYIDDESLHSTIYKVQENRLWYYTDKWHLSELTVNELLDFIANNKITKKWKPKVGETVYIPYFGSTRSDDYEVKTYTDNNWQESLYRAGFMFKTSEEASHFAQKLISDRKEELKNE